MSMTTAQRALAYLRANPGPRTRAEFQSFCVAYVVADLCLDLANASAGLTQAEITERLSIALRLTLGAVS